MIQSEFWEQESEFNSITIHALDPDLLLLIVGNLWCDLSIVGRTAAIHLLTDLVDRQLARLSECDRHLHLALV